MSKWAIIIEGQQKIEKLKSEVEKFNEELKDLSIRFDSVCKLAQNYQAISSFSKLFVEYFKSIGKFDECQEWINRLPFNKKPLSKWEDVENL
jgi:hypothetical protein